MLIRRIARPLLAATFVVGGIDALRNPQGRASAAEPLVQKGEESLPKEVTDKVPTDPVTLVRINGAVQVGSGVLLAFGKAPRIASLALAATVLPTTVTEQDFWNETHAAAKARKRAEFVKNLSLLGGVMIAAVDTEGKPSLGWRGRRAARKMSAALPLGAAGATGASAAVHLGHGARVAGEKARDAAEVLSEVAAQRGGELAHVAAERGSELADLAREHGPELAETARDRASELAEVARDRGPKLAEVARDRAADLAERVRDRSPELAETARDRATELAERLREQAPELVERVRDRAPELSNGSVDRATELATEIAERTRARAAKLRV
ncbi:DoxX family protein [Aldersonia kunmingensis]|uniref:DoxX family protein n=1 Tax=Aldersonia kunmingensis TaxID=408066 RepID=UPI00082DB009|nr:DoxX family protein [Aldersonia kunmingensis]